jgi:LysM repeat protein
MKSSISAALVMLLLLGCERAPSPLTPASRPEPKTASPEAALADATAEHVQRAQTLKSQGKLADARAELQPLADSPNASDKVLELIGEIDTQLLFTPTPAPEKVDYTIVAGDSLAKLSKQFGTTIDLIKKSNNLTRDMIRLGDRLRIYQGHFAVIVSKTTNTLRLTDNGKFFKRYRIGTGQFSKTPVGEFKITTRVAEPPWWRPDGKTIPFGDPENILGTHWLGLDVPGYGIHGTWETNSIGKQATAGCVRLLNGDIEELYTILPVGTPVTIRD